MRALLTPVLTIILVLMLFGLWSQLQAKPNHRQIRATAPCPSPSGNLPVLSKSRMCRCYHRPNYKDPSTTIFTPIPPNIYSLEKVDIDYVNWGPHLFPEHKNAICVYFGHGGSAVPASHVTPEFVVQAINEHGWPVGVWKVNQFKGTCPARTRLLRESIKNNTLYTYHNCYDGDLNWGHDEGWYTSGMPDNPQLLHYHYEFYGTYGLTALLFVEVNDLAKRPKQLKFIAEAPYVDASNVTLVQMFHIESITYDVQYDLTTEIITLVPSTTDITLNLDYSHQVRPDLTPSCLEPPPPPPPFPAYPENACACFLEPRQRQSFAATIGGSATIVNHSRLNLSLEIPPFDRNPAVDPEISSFFTLHGDSYIYHSPTPGMESYLTVLVTVLPVYQGRKFREREMIIGDFRYDTGLPVGRFIDPWMPVEEDIYNDLCDEAAANKSSVSSWTRPPFPAVGKCFPPLSGTPEPCYFHFHSDYYFTDCTESCDMPKYICAVWEYTDPTGITPVPFDFQFITNSVFYENKEAKVGDFELPTVSQCTASSGTSTIKEWNLLETHLFNQVYYKRSDVWLYNPLAPSKFRYETDSNNHSMTIVNETYLNATRDQIVKPKFCVEPSTYFLETKDNNLCKCTFWGDNIVTWQTHYGRSTSCTHAAVTNRFQDHFKIDFHSRNKDNVIVRVYADLISHPNLLTSFFVLHAIYIQAIDQYGIPVGTFIRGHYENQPLCEGNFPLKQGVVLQQYPIFALEDCPRTALQNFLNRKEVKDHGIGISAGEVANIYVYHNRWKDDDYSLVCAQFQYKQHLYKHVTSIQFIALIRIEDKYGDGHAYMVEIRSDALPNPKDLADGTPMPTTKGRLEDPNVSYPPLNYYFYRESLSPTLDHWERDCLPPVKEPTRLFDVCRHYITTPDTNKNDRPDLEAIIDDYNHICVQWINANVKFGPSHPYTVKLSAKKNDLEQPRDEAILDKSCFSLNAYRTRRKNAWHVRFRVDGTDPNCINFRTPYLKEAAMVAYNEEGYPTGRPGGNVKLGGSFELFNHFDTVDRGKHEHCDDDDIKLTLDDLIDNDKMAFHSERARCMCLQENCSSVRSYAANKYSFHQDFHIPADAYVPSMMIWGNFKRLYEGFCAIWYFPKITLPGFTPPRHIQFVLEAQIIHSGVNPIPPNPKRNRLITVRSPKYIFTYDGSVSSSGDLLQDATDPANLDASVSTSCHAQEIPIETIRRPDDNCTCELRPVVPPGSTPPPGQKPLCTLKYAYYNNIFSNKLYRVCLSQESLRHTPENFLVEFDCRTKLDYPVPPEIFPNEQITLEGDENEEYNNTVTLEPFDPTDEAYYGCGLIKKCISRHADDQVKNECIRDRSCGMIITFGKGLAEAHHPTDEVTIEIYAVARGWAAVGISREDELMGEDYVVECTKEGGEVNMYNSWNIKTGQPSKPYNHDNYRMRNEQGVRNPKVVIVRPVKAVFYQDKLYCKFYIKKRFSIVDPDPAFKRTHHYDLDKLYHYIMAFSHALTDPYGEDEGNVRNHNDNGLKSEIGKQKLAAGERLSPLPHEARKFRMHALFMIFAWMLFVTLSIFVARYFKETLINTKILKMDFWYFVHVVSGVLALICLTAATAYQLSAASGWRTLFRSNFHTYSGIVALCFFVSEILIGFVMKKTLTPKRPLINWVHTIIGHVAYNLAVLNMAFSDRVAYGFLACNFKTYIFVWMTVYYVLHAIMSYHYCWVDYIFGRSGTTRKYGMFNVVSQSPHLLALEGADTSRFSLRKSRRLANLEAERQSNIKADHPIILEAPGKGIRMFALAMFTLITCVYSFWAVRKVIHYPRHCYDFDELKNLEDNGFN